MPDKDNQTFLQKGVGVSLTGVTIQSLFFLFGSGANGKSTFIEVLLSLLGGYAAKTGADTLLMQDKRGIPNDVAALAGKRLVVASELPDGRRLNEGQVKDLTGGDSITARFLNQEFFTFKPEFTLWMYGNHKPIITGTDDGIWRRIRLIPFTAQIPENEQDTQLAAKLKAELPGILAWAVRGWQLYQQEGMAAPTAVSQATDSYRAESDILGQFLADCTIQQESVKVMSSNLTQVYNQWANENGERSRTSKWLSSRLQERGFINKREGPGKFWQGLGLLDDSAM
jgi:putative DNA primase/helicase